MTGPRVVHLSPATFGSGGLFGGGERYALELARSMADVVPTRLVSFADRPRRERIGNLDVIVLGPPWYVRGQRLNPVHPSVIRHIAWANVVHCHQRFVLGGTLAAAACRLTGRRVFVSDLGGGGWDVSAYLPAVRHLYHGFLDISRYARSVANHDAEPRASVIYGGVDTEKFSPDPAVPREPLVVYAGRLLPHKGVDDLVAALPEGLSLELIGRPYHDRFLADLKRLAEGKRVTFRADCDDADLIRAYRRALCVVLPSVYRDRYGTESRVPELLGQTLIEGMACGTPAVCTDVASMPEIVEDGATGFVVAPNDPAALRSVLERFRDDTTAAARMGTAARQRVLDHFTWPAVVKRCLAAYNGERSAT
ncbi:glycosyltransferase family 4 protein [Gemmata sp.]|uniref:glycosyltransferase family 4 protein n=1 Tax=Gemmata sp. TaxID=1914242 RepID=UPI003F6E62A7